MLRFFFFSLLSIMYVHWYNDSFDLIIKKKKQKKKKLPPCWRGKASRNPQDIITAWFHHHPLILTEHWIQTLSFFCYPQHHCSSLSSYLPHTNHYLERLRIMGVPWRMSNRLFQVIENIIYLHSWTFQ